jgi:hypothetical protein
MDPIFLEHAHVATTEALNGSPLQLRRYSYPDSYLPDRTTFSASRLSSATFKAGSKDQALGKTQSFQLYDQTLYSHEKPHVTDNANLFVQRLPTHFKNDIDWPFVSGKKYKRPPLLDRKEMPRISVKSIENTLLGTERRVQQAELTMKAEYKGEVHFNISRAQFHSMSEADKALAFQTINTVLEKISQHLIRNKALPLISPNTQSPHILMAQLAPERIILQTLMDSAGFRSNSKREHSVSVELNYTYTGEASVQLQEPIHQYMGPEKRMLPQRATSSALTVSI